jgi:hypothetical protein
MRRLERRLAEQNSIVGDDTYRISMNARKPTDEGRTIASFELTELAAVHNPGDDLTNVVGFAEGGGENAVDLFCRVEWIFGSGKWKVER